MSSRLRFAPLAAALLAALPACRRHEQAPAPAASTDPPRPAATAPSRMGGDADALHVAARLPAGARLHAVDGGALLTVGGQIFRIDARGPRLDEAMTRAVPAEAQGSLQLFGPAGDGALLQVAAPGGPVRSFRWAQSTWRVVAELDTTDRIVATRRAAGGVDALAQGARGLRWVGPGGAAPSVVRHVAAPVEGGAARLFGAARAAAEGRAGVAIVGHRDAQARGPWWLERARLAPVELPVVDEADGAPRVVADGDDLFVIAPVDPAYLVRVRGDVASREPSPRRQRINDLAIAADGARLLAMEGALFRQARGEGVWVELPLPECAEPLSLALGEGGPWVLAELHGAELVLLSPRRFDAPPSLSALPAPSR